MKHNRWSEILVLSFTLAVLSPACQEQQTPRDTRRRDERAIRAIDESTRRAAFAKDATGLVDTFYADNGSAFFPNVPIVTGKEALRSQWAAMLGSPGFAIDWQLTKTEGSRSGDLAYSFFTYQMTVQGPSGIPMHDRGKGLVVWKKQSDGSWKGEADIFNSDLPLRSAKETPARKGRSHRTAHKKRHQRSR